MPLGDWLIFFSLSLSFSFLLPSFFSMSPTVSFPRKSSRVQACFGYVFIRSSLRSMVLLLSLSFRPIKFFFSQNYMVKAQASFSFFPLAFSNPIFPPPHPSPPFHPPLPPPLPPLGCFYQRPLTKKAVPVQPDKDR